MRHVFSKGSPRQVEVGMIAASVRRNTTLPTRSERVGCRSCFVSSFRPHDGGLDCRPGRSRHQLRVRGVDLFGPRSRRIRHGTQCLLAELQPARRVLCLAKRLSGTVAQVQETSIAILATASATTAVASMPSADPQQKIATVFMILAVSSVGSGVLFYLCGRFRFGDLVRFLPFPSSGLSRRLGMAADRRRASDDLRRALCSAIAAVESVSDPAVMGILLPSLVLAVALTCCLRFSTSPFAVPATNASVDRPVLSRPPGRGHFDGDRPGMALASASRRRRKRELSALPGSDPFRRRLARGPRRAPDAECRPVHFDCGAALEHQRLEVAAVETSTPTPS